MLNACSLILILAPGPATASVDITWESSFEAAFERARKENKVVFIAVNMDDEPANERMLGVYREASIAALSTSTINLMGSLFEHGSRDKPCKRFGVVTCTEHRRVEAAVREEFVEKDSRDHVIAPQHAFVRATGEVLLSVSWEITRPELEWCFVTALRKIDPEADVVMPDGARAPRRLVMDGIAEDAKVALQPFFGKEIKEAIREMRSGFGALESMDSFNRLLVTDDKEAIKYVAQELDTGMLSLASTLQVSTLNTIGTLSPASFWQAVHPLLQSKVASVRSAAAVALEQLAAPKSLKVLNAALGKEKDVAVTKNILRALGTAGVGNKTVRRKLLKFGAADEATLRRNALLALGSHVGNEDVDELLLAKLQDTDALDRRAAALALAFGRRTEHRDAVQRAMDAQADPSERQVLGRALAVLDGGNLKEVAKDVAEVGDDELARERFFGPSREE